MGNTHPPVVALVLLLGGCATATVPVNYAPSSVMTVAGSASVKDFRYLPAVQGVEVKPKGSSKGRAKAEATVKKVAPNQIRNTALGQILIDRDVGVFVRDAVFAEMRFVGMKLDDPQRVLTGDIQEFLIDDLGYSVDWTLAIKYQLADAQGNPLYTGDKVVQRNTAKFVNVFGALNETIKLNVEELLKDPAFLQALRQPVAEAAAVPPVAPAPAPAGTPAAQ